MMVVDVTASEPFHAGRAAPLIDPWPYSSTNPVRSYDVLADGSFLAAELSREGATRYTNVAVNEFHVVPNFFEDLKARAGK